MIKLKVLVLCVAFACSLVGSLTSAAAYTDDGKTLSTVAYTDDATATYWGSGTLPHTSSPLLVPRLSVGSQACQGTRCPGAGESRSLSGALQISRAAGLQQ